MRKISILLSSAATLAMPVGTMSLAHAGEATVPMVKSSPAKPVATPPEGEDHVGASSLDADAAAGVMTVKPELAKPPQQPLADQSGRAVRAPNILEAYQPSISGVMGVNTDNGKGNIAKPKPPAPPAKPVLHGMEGEFKSGGDPK